jgi:hypothetical protein
MNFSQLHERVRIEVLRRIENGSLNATLLAYQVDCSPAHISNFLNSKRRLSLDVLDKVLRSQFLTVDDLYPERRYPLAGPGRPVTPQHFDSVPLVEPAVAVAQARIRSDSIHEIVKVRSGLLGSLRDRCSAERRQWDRFVAVKVSEEEAAIMSPVLPANAIVLIDRHYTSSFDYSSVRPTVYAVHIGQRLHFRYVTLLARHLVLRGHNPANVLEALALGHGQTSADVLVGRVFHANIEL